jgi:hypothetical protein
VGEQLAASGYWELRISSVYMCVRLPFRLFWLLLLAPLALGHPAPAAAVMEGPLSDRVIGSGKTPTGLRRGRR